MTKWALTFASVAVVVLSLFVALGSADTPCELISPFPSWMQGNFTSRYPDGSYAVAVFGRLSATITLYPANFTFTLTAVKPGPVFDPKGKFYISHACAAIPGRGNFETCTLLVPFTRGGGWFEYSQADQSKANVCPTSPSEPGLAKAIVTQNKLSRDPFYF